jgi:hypothetical protein
MTIKTLSFAHFDPEGVDVLTPTASSSSRTGRAYEEDVEQDVDDHL